MKGQQTQVFPANEEPEGRSNRQNRAHHWEQSLPWEIKFKKKKKSSFPQKGGKQGKHTALGLFE